MARLLRLMRKVTWSPCLEAPGSGGRRVRARSIGTDACSRIAMRMATAVSACVSARPNCRQTTRRCRYNSLLLYTHSYCTPHTPHSRTVSDSCSELDIYPSPLPARAFVRHVPLVRRCVNKATQDCSTSNGLRRTREGQVFAHCNSASPPEHAGYAYHRHRVSASKRPPCALAWRCGRGQA